MKLNTVIKNVTVIRPDVPGFPDGEALDLGIVGGRFARIEADIPEADGDTVIDGRGLLAFPGVVDAHQHWGIYNSLSEDATTEAARVPRVESQPALRTCERDSITSTVAGPTRSSSHRSLNSQRAARSSTTGSTSPR